MLNNLNVIPIAFFEVVLVLQLDIYKYWFPDYVVLVDVYDYE
jgi:hypothetical protein